MHAMLTYVRTLLVALAILGPASSLTASEPRTFKVVMHSDLKALDPVWSGAYIVRKHGYLIYDTLFAVDSKFQVQPQMAESARMSADGLTATIKLREGLAWHDGQLHDSMSQKLAEFVE